MNISIFLEIIVGLKMNLFILKLINKLQDLHIHLHRKVQDLYWMTSSLRTIFFILDFQIKKKKKKKKKSKQTMKSFKKKRKNYLKKYQSLF